MRISTHLILATASLCLLGACSYPDRYYDSKGNYIGRPVKMVELPQQPNVRETVSQTSSDGYDADGGTTTTRTTVTTLYDRAGYYDSNGYFVVPENAPTAPASMMPPQGLCRVWFPNRPIHQQPGIESCEDIRSRVPTGAYVIYGG